jgi:hypothetical protein
MVEGADVKADAAAGSSARGQGGDSRTRNHAGWLANFK